MGRRIVPLADRFWPHVKKGKRNECWEWVNGSYYKNPWTGADTYGCISFNGKRQGAHRASWYLHFGDIPDGLFVLHTCDNPKCVNPRHLFLGTHDDNMQDKVKKGRARGGANKGEINPEHKLTEAQALEIIQALKRGEHPADIAKRYPVGEPMIKHIKSGRNWRHIPRD